MTRGEPTLNHFTTFNGPVHAYLDVGQVDRGALAYT
jgi:hypothetical protein